MKARTAVLGFVLAAVAASHPPTLELVYILHSGEAQTHDHYGTAFAWTQEGFIVGAPGDYAGMDHGGAVYVYDRQGRLKTTLHNPSPSDGDMFGFSVAADDDWIAINARGQESDGIPLVGVTYLYDARTLSYVRTLRKPSPVRDDRFGRAMCFAGSLLAITAPADDRFGRDAGAIYLFDPESGNLADILSSPQPQMDDLFAQSLAAQGSLLVIGNAYRHDMDGRRPGVVFVYDVLQRRYVMELNGPESDTEQVFGRSVAIDEGRILVGAHLSSRTGIAASGAAYLYDAKTGALLNTLVSPTPMDDGWFGFSVALMDDALLIGAVLESEHRSGNGMGKVYRFDARSGALLQTINDSDTSAGTCFGHTLAARKNSCVIGAPGSVFDDLTVSGEAHVYALTGSSGCSRKEHPIQRHARGTPGNSTKNTWDIPASRHLLDPDGPLACRLERLNMTR